MCPLQERQQKRMRLALRHAVQVDAAFDRQFAPRQLFQGRPVEDVCNMLPFRWSGSWTCRRGHRRSIRRLFLRPRFGRFVVNRLLAFQRLRRLRHQVPQNPVFVGQPFP
jgi:hypothetical protein